MKDAGELGFELEEDFVANRQLVNTEEEEEEEPDENVRRLFEVINFAANSKYGRVSIDKSSKPSRLVSPDGQEFISIADGHRKYTEFMHAFQQAESNGLLKLTAEVSGRRDFEVTMQGYDFLKKFT